MLKRLTKKGKSAASASAQRKAMEPSVIASNMNVLGNIVSDGILDIDGQVDGNVRGYLVTVRPDGHIRGDLIAQEVYVHGTVDGLIKAESVTLFASAHVRGTIMHETITVEDGASIDGKLKRTERLAIDDMRSESARRAVLPVVDTNFDSDNDNDEPTSEREIRILENLRLIS
ncbi:MAG: polymer-forming cytoskeletal protein [Alphaproteobacteria bacterium]|nr:polymer-forming cytoskeletal protein [Alphaproteobacteria bacterium]